MRLNSKQNAIPKIPILMYHEVSEVTERGKKVRSTNPSYSVSVKQFSKQMEFLARNDYQTLFLNKIIDDTLEKHHKCVAITFDDGFQDNYTNAFPILKEFGLTATIFIATDFAGQDKYMDWYQLAEMNNSGISIQSHTVSHKPLSVQSIDEIRHELYSSKKTIEDHLGSTVDFLSAPHGMIDRRVINVARAVGYRGICTSEPGFNHLYRFPAIFKRINISDHYDLSTFEKIVQSNPVPILYAAFSKKIKNFIKTILGYNNYRKLYRIRYRIGE